MKKILRELLWTLKLIRISIKTLSLYNFDLFLALTTAEWLKFKKSEGSFPASVEDIKSGKSFDEIKALFDEEVDFVIKVLAEYCENVHTSSFERINENDVYKALDILKKYFFYLWV